MTSGNLLALETSQLIDATGYIFLVPGAPTIHKGKEVLKLFLTDAAGKQVPLCLWEETQQKVKNIKAHTVVYVYNAYLVAEATGGVHLTARENTMIVAASGSIPLASEILAANLRDFKKESLVQLSKAPAAIDSAEGPATSVNASILQWATFFKQPLPDTLFELSGGLVSLMDAESEQLLVKAGDRIWTKVNVTDSSGTVSADMGEKTALLLTDTADKDEFVDQASSGLLAFARGRLRLRYAVGKDKTEPSLTVVAASTRYFDVPEPHLVPPSDTRIIPAQLHWAAASPTGLITVTFPGVEAPRLATGILALVVGTKDPKTDAFDGGFAIRNSVAEAWGSDTTTVWVATTTANTDRLPRYASRSCTLRTLTQTPRR